MPTSPSTATQTVADPDHAGERFERQAPVLREVHLSAALHVVTGCDGVVDPAGAKVYLDSVLTDAGDPKDPVERMMVEHLVLASHRIASLQELSASARTLEAAEAYGKLAVQLTAEFRRLALALRDYRTPAQGRSTTVIHRVEQLNSAHRQEVSYARADAEAVVRKTCRDTELITTHHGENDDEDEDLHQRREAYRRGEEPLGHQQCQPAEAQAAQLGRA